jgi:hypothetical protein
LASVQFQRRQSSQSWLAEKRSTMTALASARMAGPIVMPCALP